ncbi:MAG: energy transducer TonB [Bryobacteraceae bacterium]
MSRFSRITRRFMIPAAFAATVIAQDPQNSGDRQSNANPDTFDSLPRVESATLVKTVIPGYPHYARVNRIRGAVTLSALVNTEGKVTNVKAVSGPPVFIPSTVAAVRQWIYRPALVGGVPANASTMIRVKYFVD